MTIPKEFQDLLTTKVSFAHVATVNADGAPQVTPVWFDFDGTHILINSAKGRVKDKNMRRDGRVAMTISDPDNPYRYLQIRGRVVEIYDDESLIHKLSRKYAGKDYDIGEGQVRVSYKILPEKTQTMG